MANLAEGLPRDSSVAHIVKISDKSKDRHVESVECADDTFKWLVMAAAGLNGTRELLEADERIYFLITDWILIKVRPRRPCFY